MKATSISAWIRSNVLGFVAIFIALSGTAVASLPGTDTVDSGDIINGEVRNPDIRDGAVTSGKIGAGQVKSSDLAADSVTGANVVDGAVGAADIAPDSLGGGQIDEASLDSSVLQRRLASGCAAGSAIRDVDAAGNVTCEGVGGGGSPTGPAGGDLTGSYPNPDIAAGVVGTNEIATSGVGGAEIANGAVNTSDIATDGVTGSDVRNDSLGGADIGEVTLTGADFAQTNSLLGSQIDESSLDVAIGKTAHDDSRCDNNIHDSIGELCATLSLTLPRSEHVAMLATGEWLIDSFSDPSQPDELRQNAAFMGCRLDADGTQVGSETFFGEKQTSFGATPSHASGFPGNFVQAGITSTLSAGSHELHLRCTDYDGDTEVTDSRITAIALD